MYKKTCWKNCMKFPKTNGRNFIFCEKFSNRFSALAASSIFCAVWNPVARRARVATSASVGRARFCHYERFPLNSWTRWNVTVVKLQIADAQVSTSYRYGRFQRRWFGDEIISRDDGEIDAIWRTDIFISTRAVNCILSCKSGSRESLIDVKLVILVQ